MLKQTCFIQRKYVLYVKWLSSGKYIWSSNLNFYQRMGILPLKKNVNRDKCSFATKHLTFWAFIYRSDSSLSMKPICRFAHFVPPWAQSVFSFRFSGPRKNSISSLSTQSQLHCAGRPCNVMRYLKATFLIYALSMTWCWRRWPTWTLDRRRSPMRSPTRKPVVGLVRHKLE